LEIIVMPIFIAITWLLSISSVGGADRSDA